MAYMYSRFFIKSVFSNNWLTGMKPDNKIKVKTEPKCRKSSASFFRIDLLFIVLFLLRVTLALWRDYKDVGYTLQLWFLTQFSIAI